MNETISEISHISIPGIVTIVILAIVLIVIILSVLKFLSDKDIKYKNLELTTKDQLNKIDKELSETKVNVGTLKDRTELITREVLRKQLEYASDAIMSHEDKLYEMIVRHYRLNVNRQYNIMSSSRLFVRYMLSQLSHKLATYLTDNHIGNTRYEVASYCRLRSMQLSNYIIEFISKNTELIPSSVDLREVFRFKDVDALYKFIYKELFNILINCKIFSGTITDPSNRGIERALLTEEEFNEVNVDKS